MLTSKYSNDLGSQDILGTTTSDLKFELQATGDRNKSTNLQDENIAYIWTVRRGAYPTDHFDAMCDPDLGNPSTFPLVVALVA